MAIGLAVIMGMILIPKDLDQIKGYFSRCKLVDELPMLPIGKVDKKALASRHSD